MTPSLSLMPKPKNTHSKSALSLSLSYSLLSFPFHVRTDGHSLAMIQTMSGSPNDHWLQFYHQNFPNQTLSPDYNTSITTTAAAAATTVTAASLPPDQTSMNPSSPTSATHMGPEGRVSKPTRRRSRASRRTPTTLLNTDTTNFRAMVQQFTGGPVAPFASPSPSLSLSSSTPAGFSSLAGFGLGPRASNQTMVPHPFYHHLQQQQPQQQQLYQPHNQQHYNMYSGNTQAASGGGEDAFFQRLMSNPTRHNNNNDAVTDNIDHHDGVVFMEHGQRGGFFPNTSSSP